MFMDDLGNVRWDIGSGDFTVKYAMIYCDMGIMPHKLRRKRGKRGRKMREAWKRRTFIGWWKPL